MNTSGQAGRAKANVRTRAQRRLAAIKGVRTRRSRVRVAIWLPDGKIVVGSVPKTTPVPEPVPA
jgi:hypothetical protein